MINPTFNSDRISEQKSFASFLGLELREVTLGDWAVAFGNLPSHGEMSEYFIQKRGRCDRSKFIEKFSCPSWAYDFLKFMVDNACADYEEAG